MRAKRMCIALLCGAALWVAVPTVHAEKTDYLGGYFGGGIGYVTFGDEMLTYSVSQVSLAFTGWFPFSPATSPFAASVTGDVTIIDSEALIVLTGDVGFYVPKKSLYALYVGGGGGMVRIGLGDPASEYDDAYGFFFQATASLLWQVAETWAIQGGYTYGFGYFHYTAFHVTVGKAF
jgi:hypothetical protein